jgi:hypothetical protein
MRVPTFLLCETAEVNDTLNIINVQNVVNLIGGEVFPLICPLVMVFRFIGDRGEQPNSLNAQIKLTCPSLSAPVFDMQAKLEFDVSKADKFSRFIVQQAIPMPNLTFPQPGIYKMEISIAGKRKNTIEIEAFQMPLLPNQSKDNAQCK